MSEIPERVTRYRIDNGGFLQEHSRGNLVEITSAVPAIREQVLADAKARIEEINIEHHVMPHRHDDYALFEVALNCALAALTQPQTEIHINSESEPSDEDKAIVGDLVNRAVDRMKSDGGGAATAAGAADADLEAAARRLARYSDRADDGIAYLTDTGIKDNAGALAETLEQLKDALPPGPYAKAFRERVCPVPEFPSIRETAHEAIIEGGCCIQCGLPNNSETVLFHSCQAGAPADPTCPNTGHKFSHCDCDLGIEKEES